MLAATIRSAARAALLAAAGVFAALPLWAQTPERSIRIPRVERAPRIEDFVTAGRLAPASAHGSGTASEGAPGTNGEIPADSLGVRIATFLQREPGDGVPASQATTAYLSYDDANLYVVFVCHDDPARVRANIARREDIGDDDQVVVYIDTFHDRQHAYLFAANALGIQQDGMRSESTGDEDMSFDAVWSSEGRMVEDGYVVRMAIPFRSLRFPRSGDLTWGIAVGRVIRRENEESYWPHVTKRVKGFVPQFATVDGLTRISPGRNLQLNPYSMVARARVFDDDIPDHVTEGDERIGMDGKMVVRDAITLDATLNPDFSQVETDDPQVTVNQRFEVQFPEKRPFFIENAGYFRTTEELFFPRRIVDPAVGLRATGKVGRWSIGALAINDRAALEAGEPAAGHDTWIGTVRVQRELGEESSIGVLLTDREFVTSWKYDRMVAVDGRWRLGDNWEFIGQAMRSQNVAHDGVGVGDWGLRADASYGSRTWDFSGGYRAFGPEFSAPLGFVNRDNYRRVDFGGEYTFRPESELVTQFGPSLSVQWIWDHQSGVLQDRELEAKFALEVVGGTELEVNRVQLYELFDDAGFDLYANKLGAKTEWFKWLGAEITYLWGTAVNHDPAAVNDTVDLAPFVGRAAETEVGVTLRPTTQLRIEQSYVHSSLRTPSSAVLGTSSDTVIAASSQRVFTERKWRAKINYQFSRLLSLRAIVDYGWDDFNLALVDESDPRERKWSADLLLTYLVHPGTALYLGITDERENLRVSRLADPPEVVRSRSPSLSVGRQIFVKASYLWRF